MTEENVVFVGKKPTMNYVLAVVTQFNNGVDTVILKARGKAISKAVDVAEIVRNRFVPSLQYGEIKIDTETIESEKGETNVSSIEIELRRE